MDPESEGDQPSSVMTSSFIDGDGAGIRYFPILALNSQSPAAIFLIFPKVLPRKSDFPTPPSGPVNQSSSGPPPDSEWEAIDSVAGCSPV